MTKSIFDRNRRAGITPSYLDNLVAGLRSKLNQTGAALVRPELARSSFALESMSDTVAQELNTTVNNLNVALESVLADHQLNGVGFKPNAAQMDAAKLAAFASASIGEFLQMPVGQSPALESGVTFMGSSEGLDNRKLALEAYDERENKNAVVYSIAYNMQASRQDEFGEALFPTVVVTPDQVGLAITIRIISVYNEVRRSTTGDVGLVNLGKRNILQAAVDPTLLKNDQTKVVPVYSAESLGYFVSSALIPTRSVVIDSETITTSALAFGKRFSLLGLSQTDALLETGLLDSTDSIDSSASLGSLYMRLQNTGGSTVEVIKFTTASLPTSNFMAAPQGNYRQLNLNFDTVDLKLDSTSKKIDGSTSTLLGANLSTYTVRLAGSVSGTINQETGETSLMASDVQVRRITDVNGDEVSLTTGTGATIVALFTGLATFVGFDLEAQRTNSNRRQRGQLLDTTFYNQTYQVPLLSPITCPRPLGAADMNDSSDLAALITATRLRTSNAAVERLLSAADQLAEVVKSTDKVGTAPAILGVSRHLIKAFYEVKAFDVATVVDSIKSHERAADVRAALVNQLRDTAYRMYRDTGYKVAADALAGGVAPMPTVIIATDPVIAQYLMVEGDFRTLGNDFQVKVVSTLNQTMKDKIFLTFGDFNPAKEGAVNPLHFGNMAWKPEITLVLPIHRNGANSKELTVTPSFRHIVNVPALALFNVTNLSAVMTAKVTMNQHAIA